MQSLPVYFKHFLITLRQYYWRRSKNRSIIYAERIDRWGHAEYLTNWKMRLLRSQNCQTSAMWVRLQGICVTMWICVQTRFLNFSSSLEIDWLIRLSGQGHRRHACDSGVWFVNLRSLGCPEMNSVSEDFPLPRPGGTLSRIPMSNFELCSHFHSVGLETAES